MTLSMVPKSQWSWEFSSEAHTGEVQFLFVDYKRRKALLRWEEGHWVPPGIIDVLYVRNFAEDLRKSLKLKACLWPSHVAWSMRKMCTCVRANGRITTGDLEKTVMVVACCEEKPQVVLGYDWHSLEDKEVFHLFDHAAMRIKEEIEMVVSGIYPEKRMYWERPGWLQEVLKLVETTTDSQVLKRVSIHRSSSAGAVVEVCTSKGIFFVKSSPGSRNDAVRSEAMARIAPKYCPMPVHVDRERRIMVMRDYGKAVSLWAKRDTETICAVYGTLALVQQETIGRTDELLEAGFMDTRPEALIHRFEDVVSHPELGFVENFCRNHAEKFETSDDLLEELTQFRNNESALRTMVEEISKNALKMPATVLHSDIATDNTCRDTETGKLKVIDWELGCVGHPFMDRMFSPSNTAHFWSDYYTVEEMKECQMNSLPITVLISLLQTLNLMAEVEGYSKVHFMPTLRSAMLQMNRRISRETSTDYISLSSSLLRVFEVVLEQLHTSLRLQ